MEVEGSDTRECCCCSPFVNKTPVSAAAAVRSARGVIVSFFVLFLGALFYSQLLNTSIVERLNMFKWEEPFTCPRQGKPTCSPPPTHAPNISYKNNRKSPVCPDYFRWIHEDLRTWTETGITKEMVEKGRGKVHFRLLVVNGRVYVEKYHKSFQTRDVFTIWGVLQLLRKYPGRIPDLDLMFNCNDHPFVLKSHYPTNASVAPAVFSYCANDATLDMVFPDWSFWGWPEINIKPWKQLLKEMMRGNGKMRWKDREPYAYWKGNPSVSAKRMDLLKCNVSKKTDWNARLFSVNWGREIREGFKDSNLANQCKYRYKIYVEGRAWSVSEKYILACDSLALLITPEYHDFFTRGLMPMQHYWPVRANNKCRSIKFAVDWGNNHQQQAQAIGREASDFAREELKMDYVYDYMYHLLNEYSKLLKFKPTVPPQAVEFCLESMACNAKGLAKRFMMDSTVRLRRSSTHPCRLPPPFTSAEKKAVLDKKANLTKHVELLERDRFFF